jgi:hypothetical protein
MMAVCICAAKKRLSIVFVGIFFDETRLVKIWDYFV